MNRAVHEGRAEAYHLPTNADLSAQYFLLYSMSGEPTDFEDKIDYGYRLANVRAAMDSGFYVDQKVVIEAAETYIRDQFNTPEVSARLAGRVNVDYHWIHELLRSHFRGLILAFFAVWIMGSLSFRSVVAGTLTMIPVSMALLLIYAVMGFGGIRLGMGTSMFAAIAIGLSVDFTIHTLDRLIIILREQRFKFEEAFVSSFSGTGRALFFNFSAVLLGFSVLLTSSVPSVSRFGCLVGVSVSASFLASQTVLPAFVCVFRPRLFSQLESETPVACNVRQQSISKIEHDNPLHVQGTDAS